MAMHTMVINKPPDAGKGLLFVKENKKKKKGLINIQKISVLTTAVTVYNCYTVHK